MNRYENGKIYKLVNSVDGKIYVGSTCLPLAKRKSGHKKSAKTFPNRLVYTHLNSIKWVNVRIILIESVVAVTKEQLLMREQHYIDLLKPSLNKQSAIDTCPHGAKTIQSRCVECNGPNICEHKRARYRCNECNDCWCYECNINLKEFASLVRHNRSKRHINTYNRMFAEAFG